MSLNKTWYTIEQAAAKYGIPVSQIQEWVDSGLVRTEENDGKVLVNVNDIEQELHLVPSV
jgi:hypothetical protein